MPLELFAKERLCKEKRNLWHRPLPGPRRFLATLSRPRVRVRVGVTRKFTVTYLVPLFFEA